MRANFGLQGLLTDPDFHELTTMFPIAQEMGRVSGLDNIYTTAAKVDIMEQLFQVIRYAVPDMLTQGFWESVRSQIENKDYPIFARSSVTCPDKLRYVAENHVNCFPKEELPPCPLENGCHPADWNPNEATRDKDDTISSSLVNRFKNLCNRDDECGGFAYQPASRVDMSYPAYHHKNYPPRARLIAESEVEELCRDLSYFGVNEKFYERTAYDSVLYRKHGRADSDLRVVWPESQQF